MRFSVFASGSKANCTFIEAGSTRILIDCGLSCRQTEGRLRAAGIDPNSLDAILITHEHYDHVRGLETFARRWDIPVLANTATSHGLRGVTCDRHFVTGREFCVGTLTIAPVSIVHDAAEPVGFVIEGGGFRFGQFTDLGKVTPLVQAMAARLDALVLESNHDRELLWACDYPWPLKQRIASPYGHLSNHEAGELLGTVAHSGLQRVVLGHISENSNTPDHARAAAQRVLSELCMTERCTVELGSPYLSTTLVNLKSGASDAPEVIPELAVGASS